ncbi:MAG: T9SS type A sorting domain-containing protein [Crocinitomicaceae bacterium]
MRKLLVVFVMIGASLTVFSQPISFFKTYGGTGYDFGRDAIEDYDLGYVCTGSSSSFVSEQSDAFVMKVDTLGNFVWSRNYGGPGSEWGQSIIHTLDSNLSMAGYTNSFGNGGFDFYFLKLDTAGIVLIEKTYGGTDWDRCYSHKQLPDSGFVLVGESYSYGLGLQGYIVRTDKDGDTLWTKSWGGMEDDSFSDVLVDGDSIVVCGKTNSYGNGSSDGILIKMDNLGNIGWNQVVGQADEDFFTSIKHFNNYYLLGGQRSYDYANTKEDMWVYKVEDNGNNIFYDSLYATSSEEDITMDLIVRSVNENVIIAGFTKSWGLLDGFGDIIMSKYTSSFGFVTSNTFGSDQRDQPYSIIETSDDGFLVIGDFHHQSTGGGNMYLMKNTYLWEWFDVFNDLESEQITTSIETTPIKNEINIFPNPFSNELFIDLPVGCEKASLYDLSGALIAVYNESGLKDMTEIKKGVYLINFEYDTYISQEKIVRF